METLLLPTVDCDDARASSVELRQQTFSRLANLSFPMNKATGYESIPWEQTAVPSRCRTVLDAVRRPNVRRS